MATISFNTLILPQDLDSSNGFGYATDRMLSSLNNLGYEVSVNDGGADVGICFNQPQHWRFYGKQYKIGYLPWETQVLMPGWLEIMNECDEIWTPSFLIADWYRAAGVKVPVHVYEHGVDDVWAPKERVVDGPMKFLHLGSEALRKGGPVAIEAFRKAFPNNKDVELNLKTVSAGWNLGRTNGVLVINKKMNLDELVELFHDNHVYVYPSAAEGFGLTPLQAMATAMPTITVPAWAPYARFLDPDLCLSSKLVDSPWPKLHPGKVFEPSFDDLVEAYRAVYNNYPHYHQSSLNQVEELKKHYNWDRLTQQAFGDLEHRLRSS